MRINIAEKTKFITIVALSTLLLSLFFVTKPASAQENIKTGGNIVLGKDEVINKDYFAGGETVTIDGTINGDAYLGAGKIIVNGTINGDLIAGGGEITINGVVAQDLRIAGGNITVTGEVGKNATIIGGNINLTNSAQLKGSLVSAGGNLTIYSPISRDLYLGAGDATLAGNIGGDINAGVGKLTLSSGANIEGDINYISEEQAQILPGASISGKLKHTLPPKEDKENAKAAGEAASQAFSLFYKSVTFLSLLVVGLIIIKFFPKFSLATSQTFSQNFWSSLVIGILTFVLTPITFLILLITVFGIPLALILLTAFLFEVYIAKIFVSIWLGNFLSGKLNQKWNLYVSFIAGLVLLTFLSLVPVLGLISSAIVNIVGLGALLLSKKNYYLKLKKDL